LKANSESFGIALISRFSPLREGMSQFTNVFDNIDLSSGDDIHSFFGGSVEMTGNLINLRLSGLMSEPIVPLLGVLLNLSPIVGHFDLTIVGVWLIDLDSELRWSDVRTVISVSVLIIIPIIQIALSTLKIFFNLFSLCGSMC